MKLVQYLSALIIPLFILAAVVIGVFRKVRVYDSFVSGAKEGLGTVFRIFPYLLAIFVAVKTFQASGAFDIVKAFLSRAVPVIPPEVIPVALIKPLSGSASLGLFTDLVKTLGPDARPVQLAAIIMGSAETTFYVLAVYLGAAGIRKTRYLIPVCVAADIAGIAIAVAVMRLLGNY